MGPQSRAKLESEIIRFLQDSSNPHELPEIVREFHDLADDASIKATLLMLNVQGLIEITTDWEFRCIANGNAEE